MIDLVLTQLTNPFRIGLIVALVFTMLRTEAATGRLIPLAAGVLFVAVILPSTMPGGVGTLAEQIGVGIVANLILLGVVLTGWTLARKFGR